MTRFLLFFKVSLIFLFACQPKGKVKDKESIQEIQNGIWRGVLKTQGIEIPFNFDVAGQGDSIKIELINAEERIPLTDIQIDNDSIQIPMYIFDATIHARVENGRFMNGLWVKNYLDDYKVPFEAEYGKRQRFNVNDDRTISSFDGKWEVDFIDGEKVEKAIGIFDQEGGSVTGTFILSSGDYRFLEGIIVGDTMKMSCFDGTHAYLFVANMLPDGEIEGDYWSGKTWHQPWTAKRNVDFELQDPNSIAYLKEGYDKFDIKFPNTSGEIISLSDDKYEDKVVIVQVLGTWCPNCMDETKFYTDWYHKNKDLGVEIVGLAFERKADFNYAVERIKNMKAKLGVDYEILFAGDNSQESRALALPMLSGSISFPTSIILDKKHKVRKIHSGFTGPGTGAYYEKFVEEFKLFMDKLLAE